MAVFRVERTQNYTVMSNHHLRDKTLSLKAKGLLSQMLSLPEDWDYTLVGLARINQEGKDAIRAAVQELEQAGYIRRGRVRDEKGCLRGTEYVIYEQPQPSDAGTERPPFSALPALDEPAEEKPASGNPTLDDPTQLNKERQTKEGQNKDQQNTDPQESIPFPSAPSRSTSGAAAQAPRPKRRGSKRREGRALSKGEMDRWREQLRENIGYDDFVRANPYDTGQLDELIEIMVDAVCSTKDTLRVSGNELPQEVVKSRLLKLNGEHIQFVFECLRENTTRVRNVKQYLLAVLYNAAVTIENSYAAQVSHDFY